MMFSAARIAHRSGAASTYAFSATIVARALLYVTVALAVVRTPIDTATLAIAAFSAHTVVAGHGVPVVFGPESAAAGSLQGGVGWLGALAVTVAAATRLHLFIATIAVIILTLGLVEMRARRLSDATLGIAAAAVAALCSSDAVHAGGPLAAPLFVAALFALLERPTLRRAAAATALTVVWCNVSASGLFGGAFALATALGMTLDRADVAQRRASWLAAFGACLAGLATPAGFAYPLLAFRALRIDGTLADIVRVAPSASAPIGYHLGFMLVLVLGLGLGLRGLRFAGAVPALVTVGLGLANGADLPVVGVVVAPLLAAAAHRMRAIVPAGIAFPFALLAALGTNVAVNDPRADGGAAILAVRAARLHGVHRLFCAQPRWCAFAVVSGGRVLIDDRFDRAPAPVRDAQLALVKGRVTWRRVASRYRIDAILTGSDSTLGSLVRLAPGWRSFAVRGDATLFVGRNIRA